MISRETENVQSAREVEAAFRALTTGDKPYITANELFAVSILAYLLDIHFSCWNYITYYYYIFTSQIALVNAELMAPRWWLCHMCQVICSITKHS